MGSIWLQGHVDVTRGKIQGETSTSTETSVLGLSPDTHDGADDDATDDDATDDGPARADADGPARIHANDATASDDGANDSNATHDAATAAT